MASGNTQPVRCYLQTRPESNHFSHCLSPQSSLSWTHTRPSYLIFPPPHLQCIFSQEVRGIFQKYKLSTVCPQLKILLWLVTLKIQNSLLKAKLHARTLSLNTSSDLMAMTPPSFIAFPRSVCLQFLNLLTPLPHLAVCMLFFTFSHHMWLPHCSLFKDPPLREASFDNLYEIVSTSPLQMCPIFYFLSSLKQYIVSIFICLVTY